MLHIVNFVSLDLGTFVWSPILMNLCKVFLIIMNFVNSCFGTYDAVFIGSHILRNAFY
jgi:hypothetical protein